MVNYEAVFMAKGGSVLPDERNCQVNVTNINLRHVFQRKCRNDQRDHVSSSLGNMQSTWASAPGVLIIIITSDGVKHLPFDRRSVTLAP